MSSCSQAVTRSTFERRLPGGQHDLAFKVAFGSNAAASRALRVSKMTVWRWRRDRSPVPELVLEILDDLVQSKVAEAHEAQERLRYFRSLPPKAPRPLSGACTGYFRKD